jgi:hypothetical protein
MMYNFPAGQQQARGSYMTGPKAMVIREIKTYVHMEILNAQTFGVTCPQLL